MNHNSTRESQSAAATQEASDRTSQQTRRKQAAPIDTGGWRNTFQSLSNRNFFFLWIGMLGVMAGMQMQMLARSYLTYEITNSALILGIVSAGNALPMLAFSLFGGALADRFDKKRIIQVGQLVFALLALTVGIFIYTGQITWVHLLVAGFIQGVTFSFMMPARQAVVPQLVPKELVTNAMALSSAAMSAMTLGAPAFAGGLYAWAGPDVVYFVIAGLGFTAMVLTNFIPGRLTGSVNRGGNMMGNIGEGLKFIRNTPLIFALLAVALGTTVLAQPFRFLLPVFIVDIYKLGPEYMGLMVAAMGGSSLAAALFVAALGRSRRGMLLIISGFLSALALVLIAAIPIYLAGVIIMVLLGIGDAGRRTLNQSLVLEQTEAQYRGRVMSVFMLNRGLMPLGVLPTSILIEALGAQIAIAILGAVLFALMLGVLITQKRLREMP